MSDRLAGLHTRFLSAFNVDKKRAKCVSVEKITLMFDEDSLKKRVQRVKGMQRQTETMLMCTRNTLTFPEKERKHFRGSNKGDALGPINAPDWATSWALSFERKKVLYGPNRVAVGGKSDEGVDEGVDDEEEDELGGDDATDRDLIPPSVQSASGIRKTRDDESIEPVLYQSMFSPTFYAELIHSYNLKLIIHLTAGDGNCAAACVEAKVGYVGVVFNDDHLNHLTEHLTKVVLGKLGDSASALFQPSFSTVSGRSEGAPASSSSCPTPARAPTPKAAPAPKPVVAKKKKKKSKKKSSSSSSSESGSSA